MRVDRSNSATITEFIRLPFTENMNIEQNMSSALYFHVHSPHSGSQVRDNPFVYNYATERYEWIQKREKNAATFFFFFDYYDCNQNVIIRKVVVRHSSVQ